MPDTKPTRTFEELVASATGSNEQREKIAKDRSDAFDKWTWETGSDADREEFERLDKIAKNPPPEGAIDLSLFDSAPAVGYNGGLKCDVTSGPCSCGAWHTDD